MNVGGIWLVVVTSFFRLVCGVAALFVVMLLCSVSVYSVWFGLDHVLGLHLVAIVSC